MYPSMCGWPELGPACTLVSLELAIVNSSTPKDTPANVPSAEIVSLELAIVNSSTPKDTPANVPSAEIRGQNVLALLPFDVLRDHFRGAFSVLLFLLETRFAVCVCECVCVCVCVCVCGVCICACECVCGVCLYTRCHTVL